MKMVNDFAKDGLPDQIKMAKVTPLHKKGSKTDISNYRPISNSVNFLKNL